LTQLDAILKRALDGAVLTPDELEYLLSLDDREECEALYAAARELKIREVGRGVYLRGLVEVGNICVRNCRYCGIRKDNTAVRRYELSLDEIVAAAKLAADFGYGAAVLQGGERSDAAFVEFVTEAVRRIRALPDAPALTLSFGEQTLDTYRKWREAGAVRYLLRIETTDRELYAALHPEGTLEGRKAALLRLRDTDFQVGTGVMIGLPGQSAAMLARDVEFFRTSDADMIGMGPWIPHHETPLGIAHPGSHAEDLRRLELGIKMIAVTRLQLKNVNIAATTALQSISPSDGRERGILAGANVIMPNVGGLEHRRDYTLYDGKAGMDENAEAARRKLDESIARIGEYVRYGVSGTPRHYLERTGKAE
jgi:biotin synthase